MVQLCTEHLLLREIEVARPLVGGGCIAIVIIIIICKGEGSSDDDGAVRERVEGVLDVNIVRATKA